MLLWQYMWVCKEMRVQKEDWAPGTELYSSVRFPQAANSSASTYAGEGFQLV